MGREGRRDLNRVGWKKERRNRKGAAPNPVQRGPLALVSGTPLGQPMPAFLSSVSGNYPDRAITVFT